MAQLGSTNVYGALSVTDNISEGGSTLTSKYAKLASPALTGVPTAPTAAAGTNSTQIATTAFVQAAIGAAIAASY